MSLQIGELAPAFSMTDSDGNLVDLAALKGTKVVLYFYPKDDTPGCTAQACNLNENLDYLTSKGYRVIGVSVDSNAAHTKFKKKYQLNFSLLADTEHELVNNYGVWVEKSMYGKSYMGTARTTFLIDENGIITDIIAKVDTKNHSSQIH
ncbi:thioredoxin-dependent thiol peroxidase [Aquirufa nivalisilvae]|uniref:thioredoxin-dependent peroxiredoxin n=1 Tax=Aquirufa nivalisilvae TaxID=2516557 RepID=A0A2S2DW29_9BACT|nr:thioredoxin-dependent thiol peroxidase [Aquirufa nivalisilvae]AWL09250.1 Peroxiredoxin [Aquirufa nivalisilvae]MCZ2480253.1 thioredoxin-dependent thiol peroxidase [Aquirufa nivalisilvae]MCZ2482352.1 thioredoxin-dependent thiol peroxidase [Aquirufa nivalisilvae]